mmetsp:Transcript_2728/g.4645  ORF Transcript_2728/g.4645 Transcript_2728/m.4645 type:complete len:155 (+) Transcript_2728:1329-1793(+)
MDCLDRTNVVQSVFSRNIAHQQLQSWGLLPPPPSTARPSPFKEFPLQLEQAFRESWSNNADAMSYLYTGTPALKTDFTRTGKRTYRGALDDGLNSVTRYYINNFTDGFYHDCLDLATGRLSCQDRLRSRGLATTLKLPLLLLLSFTYLLHLFMG